MKPMRPDHNSRLARIGMMVVVMSAWPTDRAQIRRSHGVAEGLPSMRHKDPGCRASRRRVASVPALIAADDKAGHLANLDDSAALVAHRRDGRAAVPQAIRAAACGHLYGIAGVPPLAVTADFRGLHERNGFALDQRASVERGYK